MKPNHLAVVSGLAVVAAGAFFAWSWWSGRGRGPDRPNILLITFDTTRADRIGAYGWPHARTPAFDGLARDGVMFTRAYSTVPVTLPAHASMLTGLYPFASGVRDNSHFFLDPRAATAAEALRDQGYQTCAVVSAFVLDHRFGLDQGFDEYRDEVLGGMDFERFEVPARNAQAVVDDAIDWLGDVDPDRPFFLWCHFYDPHHPYLTPASFPFYLGHPYDQEIAFADFHVQRLMDYLDDVRPNTAPTVVVATSDHGEGLGEHGEETHAYFVYDSTIRVPLVIRWPDGRHAGRTVDTPVSIVDIMPTLLEMGGAPAPSPDKIHGQSLMDLVRPEPEQVHTWADRPLYFECYAPSYGFGWAPVRGVRVDDAKYIDSPEPELYLLDLDPREGARHNVHAQQPDEAERLAEALRDTLDRPLAIPALDSTEEVLDADVVRRLRALGYMATSTLVEPDWDVDDDLKKRLPDYNRFLQASQAIGGGEFAVGIDLLLRNLESDPGNPRCLWMLAEAVATNPDETERGLAVLETAAHNTRLDASMRAPFLVNCGRAYLVRGERQRALDLFVEAVDLDPKSAVFRSWVCVANVHLGQPENALESARVALQHDPDTIELQVQLGLMQLCNGQTDEGVSTWSDVLTRPQNPASVWQVAALCANDPVIARLAFDALNGLAADARRPAPVRAAALAAVGQMLSAAGQHEAALRALQEACDNIDTEDADGVWWRARSLIYLGRIEEAGTLLERGYAVAPKDIRIVVDLANVRSELGRPDDAIELLTVYYEAHSDDPTAANNLAWMLAEHRGEEVDLERALELSKFASKRRVTSSAFADTLGWVHLKRGDGESAVFAFTRATSLQPLDGSLHYHLGLAYRLDEQPDRAREAFAAAIELAPTPRPPWFEEARRGAAATADPPPSG